MKLVLFQLLLILILGLQFVNAQLSSAELTAISNINIALGSPFNLATPCAATSFITCNTAQTAVEGIALQRSALPYAIIPSDLAALTNLLRIVVHTYVYTDELFFSYLTPLVKLQFISVYQFTNGVPNNFGSSFPASLQTFDIGTVSDPFPASFFYSSVLYFYISNILSGFTIPTLTKPSPLVNINSPASQYFSMNGQYFNSLQTMTFSGKSNNEIFSWNGFNTFPVLKNVRFLPYSITGTPSLGPIPSTILTNSQLTNFHISDGYFTIPSVLDLSGLPSLFGLVLSGDFVSQMTYPGVISSGLYNFVITKPTSPFSNLDAFYVPSVYNYQFSSSFVTTLPTDTKYYQSKSWVLVSNSISVIPDALCTANYVNLINNLVTDIPSCFKCAIKSMRSYIYPNPLLPVIESANCSTMQIFNSTPGPFTTGGNAKIEVYGKDLGYSIKTTNDFWFMDIPNTKFTIPIPIGVGTGKSITVTTHADDVPYDLVFNYNYKPPYVVSTSYESLSNNVQLFGTDFGNSVSDASVVVANRFTVSISYLSQTSIYFSASDIPTDTNTIYSLKLTVGGQPVNYIRDTYTQVPTFSNNLPALFTVGGDATFIGTSLTFDNTILTLTIGGISCTITSSDTNFVKFTYPRLPLGNSQEVKLSIANDKYIVTQTVNVESPCKPVTHGTCINDTLVCYPGYSGTNCTTCTALPNSQCINDILVCNPGYSGLDCTTCTPITNSQCKNGNIVCNPGYSGLDCTTCTAITNSQCINGNIVCNPGYSGLDCTTCNAITNSQCINGNIVCNPGYSGLDCTTCTAIPHSQCKNGNIVCNPGYSGLDCSTCNAVINSQCINGNIVCNPGYSGLDCTTCTAIPHSTCINNNIVCNPGYSGLDCTTCNAITNSQCINGTIVCDPGYSGLDCSTCTAIPNSECVNGKIDCNPGYSGLDCSICTPVANSQCKNGNIVCNPGYTGLDCLTCSAITNSQCVNNTLICNPGYSGDDCTTCTAITNAQCVNGNIVCNPGYSGLDCSICNAIQNSKCINGNIVCNSGWIGLNCDTCLAFTNSKCIDNAIVCDDGWLGEFCDVPCDNIVNGQCKGGKIYCDYGWKGEFCDEPIPPTNNCQPVPHGQCINGTLVCNTGYYGNDCSGTVSPGTPTFNNTSPSAGVNTTTPSGTTQYTTLISIYLLREYDSVSGKVVSEYMFDKWIPTKLSDTSMNYKTNITGNTLVDVNLTYYTQLATVEFGNRSLTIQPSTLKYTISMNEYPFKKQTNTLELVMKSQILASNAQECSSTDSNYGNDPTSEYYQFMKMEVNGVSLYGKFIKYAIVDSRPRQISNSFSIDSQTPNNQGSSLININIPHYSDSVMMDPDFSVLLDLDKTESYSDDECSQIKSKSNKLSSAKLAGIIVGVVVFGIAAIAIITYNVVKYRNNKKFNSAYK
ncbi:EGF-like domain-containing protein [Tieghemostelium lacteum]|uniref:EGF-like domain-containing protein n=1 Tax=Tieghemostelium lacteum TaxID=361077 RepID=A0A152A091_TIELA|nr:EGF-like domain-containing protein [Tieghemostelium lacteum]|eukprot:KYQ99672.1 EGF-like domain-containing protein [Tieghemostelium lacteum]